MTEEEMTARRNLYLDFRRILIDPFNGVSAYEIRHAKKEADVYVVKDYLHIGMVITAADDFQNAHPGWTVNIIDEVTR